MALTTAAGAPVVPPSRPGWLPCGLVGDSPGYQEALRVLGDGAVRDIRIIEATVE
jgi:hypothetical protein